jgi:hypothetical protein
MPRPGNTQKAAAVFADEKEATLLICSFSSSLPKNEEHFWAELAKG